LRSPDFQEKVVHMQHALKYLNFVESVWESWNHKSCSILDNFDRCTQIVVSQP
jgi:hypothetical protein